jgi:hypothetical protein
MGWDWESIRSIALISVLSGIGGAIWWAKDRPRKKSAPATPSLVANPMPEWKPRAKRGSYLLAGTLCLAGFVIYAGVELWWRQGSQQSQALAVLSSLVEKVPGVKRKDARETECLEQVPKVTTCAMGSWKGRNHMAFRWAYPKAVREHMDVLADLYEQGEREVVSREYDRATGACGAVVRVSGWYNGQRDAVLYCDNTHWMQSQPTAATTTKYPAGTNPVLGAWHRLDASKQLEGAWTFSHDGTGVEQGRGHPAPFTYVLAGDTLSIRKPNDTWHVHRVIRVAPDEVVIQAVKAGGWLSESDTALTTTLRR